MPVTRFKGSFVDSHVLIKRTKITTKIIYKNKNDYEPQRVSFEEKKINHKNYHFEDV